MVNPFLFLLYQLLKLLVLLVEWVFYPFTTVANRKRLRVKGPGVIVSNHPNTLMDPLHVISRTPRLSFFLANASLYENPIANWLLQRLYTIPISRPGKDGGERQFDIEDSFAKCYVHLEKGGIIYIAPEGGSHQERRLQPIKTGTARILLGAENRNNFQLGTRIVPVGLNYEHPEDCGSRIFIQVGEAINTSDWKRDYQEDPVEAVQQMTQALTERMQELILCTEDDEQDQLLYRLQSLLQHDEPLREDQHYQRSRLLLNGLKQQKQTQATKYSELVQAVTHYRATLRKNGVTDRGLSRATYSLITPITILGAPLWLYGRLGNWLAYETPRWLERKLKLYPGYAATVKVIGGLFSFPLFYYLQYLLAKSLLPPPWSLWFLASLPISGILAWAYARYAKPRWEGCQFRRWAKKHTSLAQQLVKSRLELKEKTMALIKKGSAAEFGA